MNIYRIAKYPLSLLLLILALLMTSHPISAKGALSVISTQPTARSLDAPVTSAITVEFDQPVDPNSITSQSFWAFGKWSGAVEGELTIDDGPGSSVTLTPNEPFSAGEQVMVILSTQIQATDGTFLRSAGYSFQFWVRAAPANSQFEEIDVLTVRTTPSQPTQAYGGVATDLNNDGWLDISIVNEITADVRVFLNQADGTGLYDEFIQPPSPVNDRASPSEPSDFNRDGNADLAVANINTSSVSILLGQGDGTFAPQQEITVGAGPRGIAVLDIDGDGDVDVANSNSTGAGSLSLMLNDGNGVFGDAILFEGGGDNEWALAAADMNEDGILDLVAGAQSPSNPQILVNLGNGDGTFTFASAQSAGGSVWMINASDVIGDGHEDVLSANSFSNNGAVLIGDGIGGLAAPVTVPTDPFTLATDIGDIDGDGDLDWVTSSFSGNFMLFINDGAGNFTLQQEFSPSQAASCALVLDIDNDGDLDLALIDEIADVVFLQRNSNLPTAITLTTPQATTDVSYWGLLLVGMSLVVGCGVVVYRRKMQFLNVSHNE